MKISGSLLGKLENKYVGYLEGEKLNDFFREFKIKFSTGHWCAGDFSDRFATEGYFPDIDSDIIPQLKRIRAAGIEGVEFHDIVFEEGPKGDVESRVSNAIEALNDLELVPTCMNINLWSNPIWKLGGFSNPKKEIREKAIQSALHAVDLAKELKCESVSMWPGSDGWDYNFEMNYGLQLKHFIEGALEVNEAAKKAGLKLGMEAKPYEPREGSIVLPTTHFSALVAKEVNSLSKGTNLGVTIDYGHEQMYGCEPAATVYALKRFKVPLINFHINTAKLHSGDEDRIAGTGDIWRMIDFIYSAIDTEYDGWFGEDQYTYRMDPVRAMALSRELFGNLFKKALLIYSRKDELEAVRETGDEASIIDIVKRIIYNG